MCEDESESESERDREGESKVEQRGGRGMSLGGRLVDDGNQPSGAQVHCVLQESVALLTSKIAEDI